MRLNNWKGVIRVSILSSKNVKFVLVIHRPGDY